MNDDDITRRDVLRGLGGLAFASVAGCDDGSDIGVVRAAVGTCAGFVIPAVANASITVPDVQGYAHKSVAAGAQIDFRISSPFNYQLSIARLGWDTATPSRDWVLKTFPTVTTPMQRQIRSGSYMHVENALNPTQQFTMLTLECWVRPFRAGGIGPWQGIMSQYGLPHQCGFGMFLTPSNLPVIYFGDGGEFNQSWLYNTPEALAAGKWHHLVAVFDNSDSGTVRYYLNGQETILASSGLPVAVKPGSAPLRIGAYGDATGTSNFLDGDVAMPVIYSGIQTPQQVLNRFNQVALNHLPPTVPYDPNTIGCWSLTEEGGTTVADVSFSNCNRPGAIVNKGTWMVGGPSYDPTDAHVPRTGTYPFNGNPYDPALDSTRGHGLRFSTTDLFDCAWNPISHSYTIPNDCPPGLYVGRIAYTAMGAPQRYDITFVVRRAASRPVAPIVVLSASNTWHAYNSSVNALAAPGASLTPPEKVRFYEENVPQRQPNYFQGFEMPWSSPLVPPPKAVQGSADPYMPYPDWGPPPYIPGYGHLVLAERYFHIWLERNGYDYDLVSDKDLHGDPNLLSQYRVLIIAGHSEYWTKEAYNNVKSFIAAGGKVIVASGNTMFWRVSYDASAIECRKAQTSVGGWVNAATWDAAGVEHPKWGELYHQHDHLRGGLMRDAGFPAWNVIGLECLGYGGIPGQYKVVIPDGNNPNPLFQTPELLGVWNGDVIGGATSVLHEWDAHLLSLPGTLPFTPPPDYTPTVLAKALTDSERFDYTAVRSTIPGAIMSHIVDWQRPGGGRVFAAGSIATGQAMLTDALLAALFRNVLYQDGVTVNVNALMIGTDGHFKQKYYDGTNWLATLEDNGGGFGTAPPTGVQWGPNSRSAMAVNASGAFKYNVNVGSGWGGWSDFGSGFTGRPAAVGWGRNRLDLFVRTTGNRLKQKGWDGVTWNPAPFTSWNDNIGTIASDPTAVNFQGNRLGVAARVSSGKISYWWRASPSTSWTFQDLGGNFTSAPTLLAWAGAYVDVFAVDSTGKCSYKFFNGTSWSAAWTDIGAPSGSPSGLAGRVWAAIPGPDQILLVGLGKDGRLKHKLWDGGNWQPSTTGWYDTLGGGFAGEPALASYRGRFVSVVAVDTAGNLKRNLWNGSVFTGWDPTPLATGARPSPALFTHILG